MVTCPNNCTDAPGLRGHVVGAVGISGDTSDRDEFVTITAIKSTGFYPEPLEPTADWDGSKL